MKQRKEEQILIALAMIICGVLIAFNAVNAPSLGAPAVIQAAGPTDPATLGTDDAQTNPVDTKQSAAQTRSVRPARPEFVNVNTASEEELAERLPGIGPALAARIVEYRELHGDFLAPEDLLEVKGIGEKKLENMLPLLAF